MIAKSLFHFTGKLENIQNIIESRGFRASYCIEHIDGMYPGEKYLAFPMVSFCDIPLKFISDEHTERYGKAGIGMSKEWAVTHKINPLLYRVEDSYISKNFKQVLEVCLRNISTYSKSHFDNQAMSLFNEFETIKTKSMGITHFIKSYEDDRNNYIDREWRWVPEGQLNFCSENNEDTRKKMNEDYFNEDPHYLKFNLKDIKYVVVNSEEEQKQMVNYVDNMSIPKSDKYDLVQKILTLESINNDM